VAPALWWFEVRNALVQGERRGFFTERGTTRFLRDLSRLAITVDRAPSEPGILTLARRHRLTLYDAAYLELALRKAWPLATLDEALASAARGESVSLVGRTA
jgi:predicted nucleic acid-binding protein